MTTEMRIVIDRVRDYYHWKVVTDGDAGFCMSGTAETYRQACRKAKRAMKRLDGIGWLSRDDVRYE